MNHTPTGPSRREPAELDQLFGHDPLFIGPAVSVTLVLLLALAGGLLAHDYRPTLSPEAFQRLVDEARRRAVPDDIVPLAALTTRERNLVEGWCEDPQFGDFWSQGAGLFVGQGRPKELRLMKHGLPHGMWLDINQNQVRRWARFARGNIVAGAWDEHDNKRWMAGRTKAPKPSPFEPVRQDHWTAWCMWP